MSETPVSFSKYTAAEQTAIAANKESLAKLTAQVQTNTTALNGLTFGQDANGEWGYKVGGSGDLIPFRNYEISAIGTYVAAGGSETILTFSNDYAFVLVIIQQKDTDNNGDNFCRVYDAARSAKTVTTWKNDITDAWTKFPLPLANSGTARPASDSNYTNDFDKGKSLYCGAAITFNTISYKKNVKADSKAYAYVSHTSLIMAIGFN